MAPNRNGRFRLILLDACGNPWRGDTFVRIEDDTENIVYGKRASYERPIMFTGLRTPPRGRHMLHIKTTGHTPVSYFIRVKADVCENIVARLLVHYRKADKHGHRISFPVYEELDENQLGDIAAALSDAKPTAFESERDGVRRSPGPEYYNTLVRTKHENHHHRRIACLLNLHAKMKRTFIDEESSMTTWGFVDQIFSIEQDRIFATVQSQLDMNGLLNRLGDSNNFNDYDSWTHDIDPPRGYKKSKKTYKTVDDCASLQLTFSRRERNGGGPEWIVDADIDEKMGVGHLKEFIYHKVTGAKTNPYSVHQLLCSQGIVPTYNLITEAGYR